MLPRGKGVRSLQTLSPDWDPVCLVKQNQDNRDIKSVLHNHKTVIGRPSPWIGPLIAYSGLDNTMPCARYVQVMEKFWRIPQQWSWSSHFWSFVVRASEAVLVRKTRTLLFPATFMIETFIAGTNLVRYSGSLRPPAKIWGLSADAIWRPSAKPCYIAGILGKCDVLIRIPIRGAIWIS